jgi:hypothetical protein
MDLNQTNEPKFTDEEMAEVDRLQSDPTSEYYYDDPDESFMERLKRKLEPYGEDFKGFVEYLFTPSRHFGTGQYSKGGLEAQMSTSGLDAEGRRRRTDSSGKYIQRVEEGQEDIEKAASFIVPFYDSGVNIANVAQEYMKPEQERDYDYIKSQFTEAGQSAAIEAGLLLMGGVAGKYGAKGIKALADKVKQYEIDPTAMSSFGAGAIRKKPKEQISNKEYDAQVTRLDEQKDVDSWQTEAKKLVKKERKINPDIKTPELENSTRLLLENKITREEHLKNVDKYKPVSSWDNLPREPSDKALVFALDSNKRENGLFVLANNIASKLGVSTSSLKIGDLFNGRLDIPAYLRHDTWIVAGTSPAVRTADNKGVTTYAKAIHYGGGDKPVRFIASSKQSEAIGTGDANKTGYATVSGIVKDLDEKNIRAKAAEYLNDPEWTQVGFDPRRQGGFYVRAGENKHVPVREASEVIQIGPLVLAKNAKLDMDYEGYNEGGVAMNDQMEMAFMQEGGIADDGMDVDPISGNEVPPGSLAEEVRDDIPAQLSEGEYVVPADVVRYYGVKFFEDLRDQAKMGLADMEANGRIGGEPVPEGGPKNENLTPEEQQAVEAMMGMEQGGAVQNPYLQQQQLYNQEPPKAVGNTMGYSMGGSPAPVKQLQAQAITPTVYNQPNYSFLSPSTVTQTSQTTEQAINQATQNVFSPVMMRSPEGVEAEAKTRAQMKQWLAAGWVIITAAETTTTPTEETTTPTDTTTTPTTTPRTGGGGTNITIGGKTGTGGFGFKNWGEEVKWGDPDSIKTFVENSTQGLLDPNTGKKITEVGFGIAGPVGGALGAAASTVPSLSSLSDLRASRFILQAQGMSTDFIDTEIEKITANATGFTNFIDNVFKEVADGDAKARAALDRLGLEYTRDEKTGDPIFSDEQKIANRAKLKRPATGGDAGPVTPTGTGISLTPPVDPKRKSLDVRKAEAQTRIDAKKRRDKRKKDIEKARSITKGKAKITGKGAKAVSATQKAGPFNKGGLMKKGNK